METTIGLAKEQYNEKKSIKIQTMSLLAESILLIPYILYFLFIYKTFVISRILFVVCAIIEIITAVFIVKYRVYYFRFTIIRGYQALFWGYLKILLEIFALWLLLFNTELLLKFVRLLSDNAMTLIFGYTLPIILK
jgi:hypothetical protein